MMRAMASWMSNNRSGMFLTMGWPLSRHALEYAPEVPFRSQHPLCDRAGPEGPSEVHQSQKGYVLALDPPGDRCHFLNQPHHARPIQKHVYWMRRAWLQSEESPHVSP